MPRSSILCPYNSALLPQSVINDARATHPAELRSGAECVSPSYREPSDYLAKLDKPLLAPAAAEALEYGRDLRPVRALVAAAGQRAGLDPSRCTDLVIAASEVAANTLRHAGGTGVIRLWSADEEVLCQVEDSGFIADPLAGHRRPVATGPAVRVCGWSTSFVTWQRSVPANSAPPSGCTCRAGPSDPSR